MARLKIILTTNYSLNHQIYIYIYIYIYVCVCVCVCVYFGSISSLIQISLNIIDIFCLHIFFWIRSYSRIAFINQFPPNTIKAIREYERIQKKICRQKMSIMFNEICIYMCVCARANSIVH